MISSGAEGHLFTWRDILSRLSASSPNFAYQVEVDSMEIRVFTNDREAAFNDLSKRLGAAFDPEGWINLAGTNKKERRIPVVSFDKALYEQPSAGAERPLWKGQTILKGERVSHDKAPVAAFFSYKGGVGRTTTAFASLVGLLNNKSPKRVLYVDADVEAPGITLLAGSEERLSWVDTLALIHDSEDWRSDALPLIAAWTDSSKISLDLAIGTREFWFMPAVRRTEQLDRVPVTPENVVRRTSHAWVIGDLLIELARALELDLVIVDLRAGISEFSSPLMLDPRIQKVIVSSCSEQSVQGTQHAIEQMYARTEFPLPMEIVVSQVPPALDGGDEVFLRVEERLLNAISRLDTRTLPSESAVPPLHRIDFSSSILAFQSLQLVARAFPPALLRTTSLLAQSLLPLPPATPAHSQDLLPTLADAANRLIYGENNATRGLIPTPALRHLVQPLSGHLPATVVMGSKGSGKTYLWGQCVLHERWKDFVDAVPFHHPSKGTPDALFFPLLRPNNLGDDLRNRAHALEQHSPSSMSSDSLRNAISQFSGGPDVALEFWTKAVAQRLGLPEAAGITVASLESTLERQSRKIVLVMDGLEDALQLKPEQGLSETHQVLIRALVVDFVNQLRDLGPRHLGLAVFVRQDLVRSAIAQNFGQFYAKYQDDVLTWSPTDALRLTLWILKQSGWKLDPALDLFRAPYDELASALVPFWNQKMGGAKQAFTDRWVLAVLADLKGRFQPRDLVRLIATALKNAASLPLSSEALRRALPACSQEKISELEAETQGLKLIFSKLRNMPPDIRKIPIPYDALGLTTPERDFLTDLGVLHLDAANDQYFIPEIFRHGLGFEQSKRGNARVLALQRAATNSSR